MLARCSQKRRTVKRGTVLGNLILNAAEEEVAPCSSEASEEAFDLHLKEVEQRLPKEFSWQKNQGKNWLEPVMDQGDCGSCYAVSTMRMLSARHKIAQNNTQEPPWSITFPLFCNEYTQGCSGGYGFLMSKWSQDVGLVPAECAKYNTAGKCQVTCDVNKLQKRYRASQHRYLGGYYGNATVAEMMEELHARGPIVVSFEPSSDFIGTMEVGFLTPAPHLCLWIGSRWIMLSSWSAGVRRLGRSTGWCRIRGAPTGARVVTSALFEVTTIRALRASPRPLR
jgi:hypothetical protein